MKRFIGGLALLGLLLLTACSEGKPQSFADALKQEEVAFTEVVPAANSDLEGVQPHIYKLDDVNQLHIYDFGTIEKRESGHDKFQERQQSLSSYPPIVLQEGSYLVLYYNDTVTTGPPIAADLERTKFGSQIEAAMEALK
ncbi:hypothetical protein K0T92_10240 [Paenibacillus oenotherae]|uniref:Lipoprotein n=1 Tax=Paenibacillus oenotherae TaxID=1435645 RepID=A0ABS7D5A3_9BACL|nr:hypothetical protein [Paenibacillus oenotherae]MBW7475127.1 hypothetical protein [Paenibacillus oenotherae]